MDWSEKELWRAPIDANGGVVRLLRSLVMREERRRGMGCRSVGVVGMSRVRRRM